MKIILLLMSIVFCSLSFCYAEKVSYRDYEYEISDSPVTIGSGTPFYSFRKINFQGGFVYEENYYFAGMKDNMIIIGSNKNPDREFVLSPERQVIIEVLTIRKHGDDFNKTMQLLLKLDNYNRLIAIDPNKKEEKKEEKSFIGKAGDLFRNKK